MKVIISVLTILILVSGVYAAGLIDISYSPYTISQSGSYIVVCDLTTGQDLNCITIQTSNVTIDLNGHTLYGAGTAVGSSGSGVLAPAAYSNIAVFNGVVRDFRGYGIIVTGVNNQVNRIRIYENGEHGIYCGSYGLFWDNTIFKNVGDGIHAGAHSIIRNNSVSLNSGHGIYADNGCNIAGNNTSFNKKIGIYAGITNIVCENDCYSNDSIGIRAGGGTTVYKNTVAYNSTAGIIGYGGTMVQDNNVYLNRGDGIQVNINCKVVGNNCYNNDSTGINVTGSQNFIGQNLCTDNNIGLFSLGTNVSYFEQNKLSGNNTNESLGSSVEGGGVLANVIF